MDNFDEQLKQLNKEWCEAGYKESVIREFAFLNITHEICGVEVNPLTPIHLILLDFLNSPFVNPRDTLNSGDIFQFLYIVSTDYKQGDKTQYESFIAKHANIDINKAVDEIIEFINDAFLDEPASSTSNKSSNKRPYTAWCVPYIDRIACEYGWTDDYIIRLPFSRIFQYLKAIEARKCDQSGQPIVLFNKYSDKASNKITSLLKEKALADGKSLVTS